MCGILGTVGISKENIFRDALSTISHRGPDGSGTYFDKELSLMLGHNRLSIIDVSQNGNQPMTSSCGNYVIIFNGEIYNFKDLSSKFLTKDTILKSTSDTEVILEIFRNEGPGIFSELDGIFALAIYSKLEKKIYLSRDRFGIKPLYYYLSNGLFLFGSETMPIITQLSSDIAFSNTAIINSLRYLWNPCNESYFRNILKHEAGSYSVFDLEACKLETESFSELPIISHYKNNHKKNFNKKNIIQETRKKLENSVSDQLISDVPVGAFLSGGLDSSAIAYFASRINPSMDFFTIKTEGQAEEGFHDDLPYAQFLSRKLSLNLHILEVGPQLFIESIEKMVSFMNEPISDPAIYNTYLISSFARKNNIKVLLSGAGGDDIFTGYRRHKALYFKQLINYLPLSKMRCFPMSKALRRRIEKLEHLRLNQTNDITNYFDWIPQELHLRIIKKEFHEDIKSRNILHDFLESISSVVTDDIDKMLTLEQRFFLREHNLNYTDLMSMAAGVEVRVPFLSNELTDFAATIPSKYQQTFFNSKKILKDAMHGLLPSKIIYRPKTGFGAPLRKWMQSDLSDFVQDTITHQSLRDLEIFNEDAVLKIVNENKNGNIDASYTIFQILTLIIWKKHAFKYN